MSTAGARHGDSVIGDLLVTGCPRSGTKYAAHLLTALGREIGHEEMKRDGISSWCMAVAADEVPWGPARGPHETFDVILHQVRNPRFVIPSMTTLRADSWDFIAAHTPCDPTEPVLLRAAKFWYYWNLHAEAIAHWRYRLEQLSEVFPEFCERTRASCDRTVLTRVGVNVNSRAYSRLTSLLDRTYGFMGRQPPAFFRQRFVNRTRYEENQPFDWAVLRATDRDTFDRVISLASSYGYTAEALRCP